MRLLSTGVVDLDGNGYNLVWFVCIHGLYGLLIIPHTIER